MKHSILLLLAGLIAIVYFGCAGENDLITDESDGDQDGFTSAGGDAYGRGGWGYDESLDGGDQEGALPPTDDHSNSQDDAAREIAEADVFEVIGDTIYILNDYRGLVTIDMSDPSDLRILGRLPLEGTPDEMFVSGDVAVVLVTNIIEEDPSTERYRWVSKALSVDVSNPSAPAIIREFPMLGQIVDTRKVGKIIYVVSSVQPWWQWCYYGTGTEEEDDKTVEIISINAEDPANVFEVDREALDTGGEAIYVTTKAMYVANATQGYWEWDDSSDGQGSTITYLDISDPEGQMETKAEFHATAIVQDRFKMHQNGDVFAVCSNTSLWWNGDTIFETFNVSSPDDITRMGRITIMEDEALHATRFSGDRAYIVTFRNVDPLFVVDFSDPNEPRELGNLVIPGWSTHLEIRGTKIYGVGIDNDDGRKVKVALFDASDPSSPTQLDMVTFGEGYSWSEANNDWKAFKIYDDIGLILVPTSGWDEEWYTYSHKLHLIDFDAASLTLKGSVESETPIRRGFRAGDYLASLSQTTVQLIDYSDRDNPEITSEVIVAAYVGDLHRCGGVLCNTNDGWYDQSFRLRLFDPADPGDTPYWKSRDLQPSQDYWGYSTGLINFGPIVYLVDDSYSYYRYGIMEADSLDRGDAESEEEQTAHNNLFAFDLSNPLSPRYLGAASFGDESSDDYYYYYDRVTADTLTGAGLLATKKGEWIDEEARYMTSLELYDVHDINAVEQMARFSDINPLLNYYSEKPIINGNFVWHPDCEPANGSTNDRPMMRCYAVKIDATNVSRVHETARINIPGHLVGVNDEGNRLYAIDRQFTGAPDEYGYVGCSYTLEILSVTNGIARRLNSIPLYEDEYCWYDEDYYNGSGSGSGSEPGNPGDESGVTPEAGSVDSVALAVESEWNSYYGGVYFEGDTVMLVNRQYRWNEDEVAVDSCYYWSQEENRIVVRFINGTTGEQTNELTIDDASWTVEVDGGGLLATSYDYSVNGTVYNLSYITADGQVTEIEQTTGNNSYYYGVNNPVKIGDKLYLPYGWNGIHVAELQ